MSNGADRFSSGKKPMSHRKPKKTSATAKPTPIIPVNIEDEKTNVIGRAQALFLGKGLIRLITTTKLKGDQKIGLRKKSNKLLKERYWACIVKDTVKEGQKKKEYDVIES